MATACLPASTTQGARPDGKLELSVVDEETGRPLAARIELRDARQRLVRIRGKLPENVVATDDGLYFDGKTTLALPRGAYTFVIESGPEFLTRPGNFQIDRHAEDSHSITLRRRVDMEQEGWLAGDVDVRLKSPHLDLIMRARGIDVASFVGAVNDPQGCRKSAPVAWVEAGGGPAWPPLWAAADEQRGGRFLMFGVGESFDVCRLARDRDSLVRLGKARDEGAWVIGAAGSWEFPIWAASGKLDAVQIMDGPIDADAAPRDDRWRPRDMRLFPGKQGEGRYRETIYHYLLNCGLRIPPVAGSGAGSNKNPVGASRTYVYCGAATSTDDGAVEVFADEVGADEVRADDRPADGGSANDPKMARGAGQKRSPAAWLAGLRAGRVSVTNGPLLRTTVEGEAPGHVFSLARGERRVFQIGLQLAFYAANHVEYLEILKNGQPVHNVRLDELAQQNGRLPPLEFDASGWFCVRAVTDNIEFYQWATTGPYYVESEYQPYVSRRSAKFFLDWATEGEKKFAAEASTAAQFAVASRYWKKRVEEATAE